MAKWQIFTVLATLLSGFVPIFSNKNVQNLGPVLSMVVNTAFWTICLSIWLCFNPPNLSLISKKAVMITIGGQTFGMLATYFIFRAYQTAPEKLSTIIIITSFAVVVTAIINNFLKDAENLSVQQWLGAAIAMLGISLVNWKR